MSWQILYELKEKLFPELIKDTEAICLLFPFTCGVNYSLWKLMLVAFLLLDTLTLSKEIKKKCIKHTHGRTIQTLIQKLNAA